MLGLSGTISTRFKRLGGKSLTDALVESIVASRHSRYYWRNREKRLASGKKYYRRLRKEALDHYGGVCSCCGESRYQFLSIDHKNGGGNKHAKSRKKNITIWLKQNGYPDDYQILCFNCNSARGFYGYCCNSPE